MFSYPSVLTYALDAQKNRLNEYPQYVYCPQKVGDIGT